VTLEAANPFEQFRALSTEEWIALLKRSLTEREIDGVEFPGTPDEDLQLRIHGISGTDGVEQAGRFYALCRKYYEPGGHFLDFGPGWGRITWAFMRDFPLGGLFGYEPNAEFCLTARRLNPYSCFIHGPYWPARSLPSEFFDVVVSYSVFSHLPEAYARAWLAELGRSLRAGGTLIVSTLGPRWLGYLEAQARAHEGGEEIHPFAVQCLETAGDVSEVRRRYEAGEFVSFGRTDNYHDGALIPYEWARQQGRSLGLELVCVDTEGVAQDAFVFRRV
jgi:SAM-dependent methyltransferase